MLPGSKESDKGFITAAGNSFRGGSVEKAGEGIWHIWLFTGSFVRIVLQM